MGLEDPLEKQMATHSSILAWRISCTDESGGLQSWELQTVGHDFHFHFSCAYLTGKFNYEHRSEWKKEVRRERENEGVTGSVVLRKEPQVQWPHLQGVTVTEPQSSHPPNERNNHLTCFYEGDIRLPTQRCFVNY